jgi:hypothetical protein
VARDARAAWEALRKPGDEGKGLPDRLPHQEKGGAVWKIATS